MSDSGPPMVGAPLMDWQDMTYGELVAALEVDLGLLRPASNLSDVLNVTTARSNLGFGQPARAFRGAALALGLGWTLVPVDTVSFDPKGNSFSAGQFPAPAQGYYLAMGQVNINNPANGTQQGCGIWKNGNIGSGFGGQEGTFSETAGGFASFETAAGIFSMAKGDTLGLYAYTGVATTLNLAATTDFINDLYVMRVG